MRQLRCYIAELFLHLALIVAPADSDEEFAMAKAFEMYLDAIHPPLKRS